MDTKTLLIEEKPVKVATKIKFMVVENIIECSNAVYRHSSQSVFKVMRLQMEKDIKFNGGRYWSYENVSQRNVEGCEEYGEFRSKELAQIFCDALNIKPQIELKML
tara:strand:- start:152 stop:469 length:318 start_codon:yes stop_codon:yes gene_type:complete